MLFYFWTYFLFLISFFILIIFIDIQIFSHYEVSDDDRWHYYLWKNLDELFWNQVVKIQNLYSDNSLRLIYRIYISFQVYEKEFLLFLLKTIVIKIGRGILLSISMLTNLSQYPLFLVTNSFAKGSFKPPVIVSSDWRITQPRKLKLPILTVVSIFLGTF